MTELLNKIRSKGILLELVNGELKLYTDNPNIDPNLIAEIKQKKRELIEFLQKNEQIEGDLSGSSSALIPLVTKADSYVMSSSQKRLWVLSQFEEDSTAYNMPGAYEFKGDLNGDALSRVLLQLIDRHEILRTVFKENEEGEVRQYIIPTESFIFSLSFKDLRSDKDREKVAEKLIQSEAEQPFDLENGPLIRAGLLQMEDDRWIFSFTMHHIVSDGWSMGVIIREILSLYHSFSKGYENPFEALRIQYKDYASWQQSQLSGANLKQHTAYWLDQFEGEIPVLDLPTDYNRPALKTFNGGRIVKRLSLSQSNQFKQLCQEQGSTLFMGLLGLVNTLLYRYTGQEDIVIGSPIAGRDNVELEGQIGFYINTLALRSRFKGSNSFIELLSQIKQTTLDAYEHQVYPFDELVEALNLQRDMSRSVLFDVMVVLQNTDSAGNKPTKGQGFDKLEVSFYDLGEHVVSKFDLTFDFEETENELFVSIEYNSDLYSLEKINRMADHLSHLLESIITSPNKPLHDINYLGKQEKQLLLIEFNNTKATYLQDTTLVDLIEAQAEHIPENIAVAFENNLLNYRELNKQANQLAHYLRNYYRIRPDDLVGIKLDRSEQMIVVMLAILKSGGAYVPVDLNYPQDRIDYILNDSKCKVVIDEHELALYNRNKDQYSGENPSKVNEANHLAYIIYTSGSTGNPKGVMITHKNVFTFLEWCKTEFSQSNFETVFGVTSICFDLSIFEIFFTLSIGKKIRFLNNALSVPQFLESEKNILLNTVPSVVGALLEEKININLVKVLNMAGEPIPQHYLSKLNYHTTEIRNLYGPSEDTTYSTIYRINEDKKNLIGKPIANTVVYIVDGHHDLVPIGIAGEICISGTGISRGYLNKPMLTSEKFVDNPFQPETIMYKTGDIGRWLSDGNIELIGRKDNQVKIRGYRIELGEIENTLLSYEGIEQAIVTVKDNTDCDKVILAYFVGTTELNVLEIKQYLLTKLPSYMVPYNLLQLKNFPLTPNGKIDKKALPNLLNLKVDTGIEYVAPDNETEERLIVIWSNILGVDKENIGVTDNFFDLGGNSLKIIKLAKLVGKEFHKDLKVSVLFQYANIRSIAGFLDNKSWEKIIEKEEPVEIIQNQDIALVGMSCHFPKSINYHAYWENLCQAKELITTYDDQDLLLRGVPEHLLKDGNYIKSMGAINDKDHFDNVFFDYLPEEASLMDPQTRLFHEHCWMALEDAGYASLTEKYKIGLFAGSRENNNWKIHTYTKESEDSYDPFYLDKLSSRNFISSLVSYKLNLRGPSVYIDTACSTSLVAVHTACRSLLTRECSIALAGGVSMLTSKQKGYYYQEDMILSSDGHCRSFDKDANGTTDGEGVGVVVLKRLNEALRDGDHIYCVIKASSINNDGHQKVGYTAPSVEGQADCIRTAHKLAGIAPSSITYIEAHGTGTRLGDPIEVSALNAAFNVSGAEKYCALGSVKTNMGHLDAAAGVAGLIKTALSLYYKKIPASLHYKEANPEIDFAGGPFYVNTESRPWISATDQPLRAGVSSFGIGGTNAHLVLEEAPILPQNIEEANNYHLLTLSAKTESSLSRYIKDLQTHIETHPDQNISDLSYSLQTGRKAFLYRRSLVYKNLEDLQQQLSQISPFIKSKERNGSIVFMFSGAGSQYSNMGQQLYEAYPYFRAEMDKGFDLLKTKTGIDYKELLYPLTPTNEVNTMLHTQPVIFIFGYSLAKLMQHWGINPNYVIGHSIGEYVAACVSGVFSYEDALHLVIKRGELMQQLSGGSMLSVPMTETEARSYLSPTISLAAINAPEQLVFSGDTASISTLMERLDSEDVTYVKLHASQAGHSQMMDVILDAYRSEFSGIVLHAPKIPILSNVTGNYLSDSESTSVDYWVYHMRKTVRFSDGLNCILSKKSDSVFIELGGGHSLTSLLKQQHTTKHRPIGINLVRHPKEIIDDQEHFLEKLGQLWNQGINIDWKNYYSGQTRRRLSLPTYSFEPTHFTAEVDPFSNMASNPFTSTHTNYNELKDWVYYPIWKNEVLPSQPVMQHEKRYLVFTTDSPFCRSLCKELKKQGADIIEVMIGNTYERQALNKYNVCPSEDFHFKQLFVDLQKHNMLPTDIIYTWGMNKDNSVIELDPENTTLILSYFSITYLLKGLLHLNNQTEVRINILTNLLYNISGNEKIAYKQSLALGIVNAIPQELAIPCKNIDVNDKDRRKDTLQTVIDEITGLSIARMVAIRYGRRWVPNYQRHAVTMPEKKQKIKTGGIYLITGGLGNVGFILAKHLLVKHKAKVILTGRKTLVQKIEGEAWVARLNQLKMIGDGVEYYSLDVADANMFRSVVDEIENEFGKIDGVIHAAGLVDINYFELLEDITIEKTIAMFSPKVKGIENLYESFKGRMPDFVWITSSLASVLAGLGYGSYSSANLYMDHFVTSKQNELPNWKCIGLSEMLFTEEEISAESQGMRSALKPEEICELFEWSLGVENQPVILETVVDLSSRLYKTYEASREIYQQSNNVFEDTAKSERPDLSSTYIAPETETEKRLVEMLENFMHIDSVGIEDDFFELGGDSLKAMVLLKRIRKEMHINLGLKDFFIRPTIKQIAAEIDSIKSLLQKKERSSKTVI